MDNERAEYLVQRYSDTILRIGYTWLGNLDDAKDICQIALIHLLEDGRLFPDTKQERAWVIRVAINACKNWKRSAWFRHRAGLDAALALSVEAPEPEDDMLLGLIQQLPLKYRQVIYMRYYEEYEVKEIAGLLNQSPALVSTHLARAKAKLKTMLGGNDIEASVSERT